MSLMRWIRHFCWGQSERIVGGVEVGDEDPVEVLEELLQEVPLPRGPIHVDHFLVAGEDPDISLPRLELDLGLVNMQDLTGEDRGQEPVVGRPDMCVQTGS